MLPVVKRGRNSGRRFEALALLDGRHHGPDGFPGWTSAALAQECGIAWSSAHHLLARLKSYGLVENGPSGGGAKFERLLKGGRTLAGEFPDRTLVWSTTTPKGSARLEYFGGHEKWCPICRKGRPS